MPRPTAVEAVALMLDVAAEQPTQTMFVRRLTTDEREKATTLMRYLAGHAREKFPVPHEAPDA